MRLHPIRCLLEGATIAWIRASGWGSDVLFLKPGGCSFTEEEAYHPSHVFPASEPKSAHSQQVQSQCLARRVSFGQAAEASSCQDIL